MTLPSASSPRLIIDPSRSVAPAACVFLARSASDKTPVRQQCRSPARSAPTRLTGASQVHQVEFGPLAALFYPGSIRAFFDFRTTVAVHSVVVDGLLQVDGEHRVGTRGLGVHVGRTCRAAGGTARQRLPQLLRAGHRHHGSTAQHELAFRSLHDGDAAAGVGFRRQEVVQRLVVDLHEAARHLELRAFPCLQLFEHGRRDTRNDACWAAVSLTRAASATHWVSHARRTCPGTAHSNAEHVRSHGPHGVRLSRRGLTVRHDSCIVAVKKPAQQRCHGCCVHARLGRPRTKHRVEVEGLLGACQHGTVLRQLHVPRATNMCERWRLSSRKRVQRSARTAVIPSLQPSSCSPLVSGRTRATTFTFEPGAELSPPITCAGAVCARAVGVSALVDAIGLGVTHCSAVNSAASRVASQVARPQVHAAYSVVNRFYPAVCWHLQGRYHVPLAEDASKVVMGKIAQSVRTPPHRKPNDY